MKDDDEEFFRKMGFQIIKIDPGPNVNCDMCNEDYMNSEEKGGFMFGTNAVCPKCAPKLEKDAFRFGETKYITERARKDETYRDFVYRMRARQ
jgi:hypothetical protein